DWVVGIRGKTLYKKLGLEKTSDDSTAYRIVFAMKVASKVTFAEYYEKFPEKRPDFSMPESIYKRGDNIYRPLRNGEYKQLKSQHTEKNKAKDLSGKFVLISDQFYYFGSEPVEIPKNLSSLVCGRGHKSNFDKSIQDLFLECITSKTIGINARPSLWDEDDGSWKQ
ncbi:MAG: hypothetical protein WCO93_08225, partial [bacterium]